MVLFCLVVGVFPPKFWKMIKYIFKSFWNKKLKFDQNKLTWFMI